MARGLTEEDYQRILAANPDWQPADDEGSDFQQSYGTPGMRGGPSAVSRRQPAPMASEGGLRFFDRPDSEQYLDGEQKKALKSQLYAALADKMQRRGKVTNSQAYNAATDELAHQKARYDGGHLLTAMSKGASMAGTLGGKRADSDIVPAMNEGLYRSTQGMFDNMRQLRGMEEQSNMNDLQVARYVSGLEQADDTRKDRRQLLYEQMLQRRGQGELNNSRLEFDKIRHAETERHNKANEDILRNRASSTQDSLKASEVLDQKGLPLNFNNKNGQYSEAQYPAGAKLKPKESADKPLTEGERAAAGYYNNAKNAIAILEKLEDEGYRVGTTAAIKGMIVPDALEGHAFSKQDLMYRQAVRDFVAAKLRLESGASISPSEALGQGSIYMSQAGEPDDVLLNKRKSRREALKGLSFKAGRGAEQISKMGDQRDIIKMPGDAASTQAPKDAASTQPPNHNKIPEDMTDEERQAELQRLRKSVGK